MRMAFLGTPDFAVASLRALVAAGHEVVAAFTQPDRPKGRGHELAASPVKIAATELGIPVHQPERIRRPESIELIRSLATELMVVVGYGQIIPQNIIDLPAHGILNVHASLLPKYRGAAPIQWAIANGEMRTGVTIMRIDAGLDTGDMLRKADTLIGGNETAPDLSARLAPLGADLLIEAIKEIAAGRSQPEKQNNDEATFAPILKKQDGRIDWKQRAVVIYNRWRGFQPWPGAYTFFRGQQFMIRKMALNAAAAMAAAGTLSRDGRRLFAAAGENSSLELLEVQLAGKKPMSAEEFLNGYKLLGTEQLGDIV